MKTGIISGAFWYLDTPDERFRRMKELGFGTVDESLEETERPYYESRAAMERHCAPIRAAADRHCIEVFQVHGSYGAWEGYDDPGMTVKEISDNYKLGLYGCHLLGCRNFVIHPTVYYGRGKEYDQDTAVSQTVRIMEATMEECEKYGINLCLENMPMTHQRISPPSGIAEAVNQVKSDYCRICIDVGHQALFHRDIGEDIRIAGKKMACLHVHDSDGYNDIHILPFTGVTNWDSFTDALAEIGYSGSMNLETETARCHYSPPHLTRMTEELLAATARYLADEVERKKNI